MLAQNAFKYLREKTWRGSRSPSNPTSSNPSLTNVQSITPSPTCVPAVIHPALTNPIPKPAYISSTRDGLDNLSSVLRDIPTAAGYEPLRLSMDKLVRVIATSQGAIIEHPSYAALRGEFEDIFVALHTACSANNFPPVTAAMNNLFIAIIDEIDNAPSDEKERVAHYLTPSEGLSEFMEFYQRVKEHLNRLKLNIEPSMWNVMDELEAESRLAVLMPSMSALYNSVESRHLGHRECAPETCSQILASITHWRRSNNRQNMFWMKGQAGTGKTTIAHTLCARLEKSHELGASFFCTQFLPACREVNLILPTIAFQLAQFSRPFYCALSRTLLNYPNPHNKALTSQLEDLIVRPLREVALALPTNLLVVIDALDECEDTQGVGVLLEALVRYTSDLPVKIFVSSQSETFVAQELENYEPQLILHDLNDTSSTEDIELYLDYELRSLGVFFLKTELEQVIQRTGRSFIYVATMVRFIATATTTSLRTRRIRDLPGGGVNRLFDLEKYTALNALYATVLTAAFETPGLEETEKEAMKLVLDTVICAQELMTLDSLAGILGIDDSGWVQTTLNPLLSVLHVSQGDSVVTILHSSFYEYMLNPTHVKHHGCHVQKHHSHLAELCFDRIKTNKIQFNICGLESSFVLDEHVPNLEERARREIPRDLLYACRYWALHLEMGAPSGELLAELEEFLLGPLLLWMEVLNLRKLIDISPLMLAKAQMWCQANNPPSELNDLVRDAYEFAAMFTSNDVSRSTPHLYVSMLSFWPTLGLSSHDGRQNQRLINIGGTGTWRSHPALLRTITTDSAVESVAFSPDGTQIASGSDNSTLRMWDVASGKPVLHPLKGHASTVRSVAFSPNNSYIASGSDDCTIRLWDATSGKPLMKPLVGHTAGVRSVVFSPDSLRVISGSIDETIRVWNVLSGSPLMSPIMGHTNWVNSVTVSPDGMRIASGSFDTTIRVWDVASGKSLVDPLRGHTHWVTSVVFLPNGIRIASGSFDNTIRVWDPTNREPMMMLLHGHTHWVRSVASSPDGAYLVSSSFDKSIRVWDASSGNLAADPIKTHAHCVNSVSFSPYGTQIASCSSDKTIRLWDLDRGAVKGPPQEHTGWIHSVAFAPDGKRIASASSDKTIQIWDATSGSPVMNPLKGHTHWVKSVAFSPDGAYIVSGSFDKTVRVWDATNGKPIANPFIGHTRQVNSVAFSPDSVLIASGSFDQSIIVWYARSGLEAAVPFVGHTGPVSSVAFSPDGTRVVSGSFDKTIRVWDTRSGQLVLDTINGHANWVNSVVFSPDGLYIASGSADRTISLWDSTNGKLAMDPFVGHTHWVNSVAFSPDGQFIVSGSSDNTIRVWDTTNGASEIEPLLGHVSLISSVAFSPGGEHVASGSFDKMISVWDVCSPRLKQMKSDLRAHKHSHQAGSGSAPRKTDGWVRDQHGQPLLWLPANIHCCLPGMRRVLLIPATHSVELDFTDASVGESWVESFRPE